jgi:hypothetical protein
MNLRFVVSCGLVCAALLSAGCDEGRKAPGRTGVQVVNAAPGFEVLTFMRERDTRNAATMAFKGAQEFVWDVDTYDFTIGTRTLDERLAAPTWTFSATIETANTYEFVLTDVGGEIQPIVLTKPPPPASDAQIVALNAGSALPAMDLYLERPGVGIAGATPRGTFNALEQIAARTLPSGEYELFLTAAGDPATVLLASTTINLPAGATSTLVVTPEGGLGTALMSVLLLQSTTTTTLYDRNTTAEIRFINAPTDRGARDIAINSQFTPPLFPAAPFGEPTAYATTPIGAYQLQITPVGNPGVLELDQAVAGTVNARLTALVTGPTGTLAAAFVPDDGRSIYGEAKLRLASAAAQFPILDFVLTPPDGNPNDYLGLATLATPAIAQYAPIAPGEYDLYLRIYGSTTIVSGPTRLNVAGGGIYGVLAVDGPDTATAEVRLFDDFVP